MVEDKTSSPKEKLLLIPDNKSKKKFLQWKEYKSSYAIVYDKRIANIAFIFIHGDQQGFLGEENYTIEELAEKVSKSISKKIRQVFIVACHGGVLPEYSFKGVNYRSLHTDINTISVEIVKIVNKKTKKEQFGLIVKFDEYND